VATRRWHAVRSWIVRPTDSRQPFIQEDDTMFGAIAPYLVAISAALFSAFSALTLIYTVRHFDPPATPRPFTPSSADSVRFEHKIAV
jgi:hypothetical protein